MKNKDDFRTFVVIAIVCAVCLIIGLVFSYKKNTEKMLDVSDYNEYFSNVNYINSYINYIGSDNETAVYSMLDKKYIKDNDISLNNVFYNVGSYDAGSSFETTSMKYVKIRNNYLYYVSGMVYVNSFFGDKLVDDNFNILIFRDVKSNSYSLYPVSDNYDKVINSVWRVKVNNNEYNTVKKMDNTTSEQICVMYFSRFVDKLFSDVDSSYELLSDDMKNKYSDINSFKNFINNNINRFSTVADKCRFDSDDDVRIYSVIDENGNIYSFNEKSVMNYDVNFTLN